MENLDALFTSDLDYAVERARQLGRYDVADFLTLKASNDSIRSEAVRWLFDTVLEVVVAFNSHGAKIIVERKKDHSFKYGSSKLTGKKLELRQGLRCLIIEAGWTRRPGDGIMRGGSLAYSRISHFGKKKETEEIVLLKYEESPQWFSVHDEKMRVSFNAASLKNHFEVFLGE